MFTFYLIAVNLLALFIYGYDKYCAKNFKCRIPEKVLISSAVIGGSIGAYLGMMTFRHKTNHEKFQIAIPSLLAIQTIILFIIY